MPNETPDGPAARSGPLPAEEIGTDSDGAGLPATLADGAGLVMAAPRAKGPLIVLGMHRSGTSMLTGALALAGAWAGRPDELTDANPENPKGFWERRDLRAICNELLGAAGAEWWRIADFDPARVPDRIRAAQLDAWRARVLRLDAARAPWVVKEPRLCFVLPLLRPAMVAPVCVLMHRDPLEVARSLAARNGFGLIEGLALWEAYTRRALIVSADLPRSSILHEELIARPSEALAGLVARLTDLGVAGLAPPDPRVLAGFVTPDLHRQHADGAETEALLSPGQARLWDAVRSKDAAAEAEAAAEELSSTAAQALRDLDARHEIIRALGRERARLARALETRRAERMDARRVERGREAARARIQDLEQSRHNLRLERTAARQRAEEATAACAAETAAHARTQEARAAETAAHTQTQEAHAAETAAHARTQKALAAEKTAHTQTQEVHAAETAAHARTQKALAAEKTAHTQTQEVHAAETAAHTQTQEAFALAQLMLGHARRDIGRLKQARKVMELERNAVQKELAGLRASTSWRVSAPLRLAVQRLKQARRGLAQGGSRLRGALDGLGGGLDRLGGGGTLAGVQDARARLRRRMARIRAERLVRASDLFDPAWYLAEYPEAAQESAGPLRHFIAHARREGLNPSPAFDTLAYMRAYPDVVRSGLNPLVHYLRHGRAQGRRIEPARPRTLATPVHTLFDPGTARDWAAALRADPAHARMVAGLAARGLALASAGSDIALASAGSDIALASAGSGVPPDDAREMAGPGDAQDAPLVSVVIPTRDRVALLPQAIASVRAQSYPHWELIVVDDGSTDGTAEHLSCIDEPRLRVVRTEGLGVSGARNAGLDVAQGALTAYLDSDNFWMPDYLELMVAEFARAEAGCVYAVLKVREETAGKPARIWHRAQPFDFEALKFSNSIDLNIFMHRAELVSRLGGFDTDLRRAVDWDLILRYVRHEKVSLAYFVGAEYDHSDRADRLTVSELYSYKNVVRNKHWIDWRALAAQARDPDLVSVVLCIQSPVEQTESRLAALFTHPAGAAFELILVDNNSDAVSKAILSEWAAREPAIRLVEAAENVHVTLGSNLGIAASHGAVVVLLDDRVEVSPEWLRALVRPLTDPRVRGVQPKILETDGSIRSVGYAFAEQGSLAFALHAGRPGDFAPTNRPRDLAAISGLCAAFRAQDLVRARGYHPIYSAEQYDVDLGLRIGGGERVFRLAPDAVVRLHPGGPRIRPARIEADRRQFAAAWAGRLRADADAHLAADGLSDPVWRPDVPAWAPRGLAVMAPVFAPAGSAAARGNGAAEPGGRGRVIALKIGCPRPDMKDHWGDYHFAVALAAAFARKGWAARIDFAADPDRHARPSDINLVLRGRQRFEPKPGTLNLMWLISHPDRVTPDEMRGFDHTFVASKVWTERLVAPGVSFGTLLQCTDASRFFPQAADPKIASHALFVANSRNVLRDVVREAIEQDLAIDIYGEMWEDLAPPDWIRAEKIENVDLPRHYASAQAVLNDHWDSMRENGFVSNRIFDVLACAAPLVTDRIIGLPDEIAAGCTFFGEGVTLSAAVKTARAAHGDPEARAQAQALARLVHARHSFDARADAILAVIAERLSGRKPARAPERAPERKPAGSAAPSRMAARVSG